MTTSKTNQLPEFSFRRLYPLIFVIIFLLHAPLLRLPFFWDEAGFYIPAAYDLAHSHTLIAKTTLDTGHPPLSAAYLALWFTISGWKPAVARVAMLLLAARSQNGTRITKEARFCAPREEGSNRFDLQQ